MARLAMEDLCINLLPTEPLPSSYFGLVQRLQSASPQVHLWKRFACLEGARLAYASVRTHYPGPKAEVVAVGPPEGKNRVPEQYFPGVMEGARITEARCSKHVLLE